MPTCKECINYDACYFHIDKETSMTVNECITGFKHKDQYVKLPAYIGQQIWVPHVYWKFNSKEVYSEVREGKVSGLQQKVDKSWKIRISVDGSVSDYTVDEFNKRVFLNEKEADTERRRQVLELEKEHGL